MIPKYVENCFPVAVDNTILQDTKLIIEVIPVNGVGKNCKKYSVLKKVEENVNIVIVIALICLVVKNF